MVVPLDVSPSEERLLLSYCGARRFAYNWVINLVTENLAVRQAERAAGVPEERLTPTVPWSRVGLDRRWHDVRHDVAPWWPEVSMHAFRSGITDAAAALKNWSDWKAGKRKCMRNRKWRLGRSLADASLGELRRQLTYKTADRGHSLVVVGRFYPSSKTCSACGEAKATLSLSQRVFRCDRCGHVSDRDVNAARSIANEATRVLDQNHMQRPSGTSPGYDRETLNADRRPRKTSEAQAETAAVA